MLQHTENVTGKTYNGKPIDEIDLDLVIVRNARLRLQALEKELKRRARQRHNTKSAMLFDDSNSTAKLNEINSDLHAIGVKIERLFKNIGRREVVALNARETNISFVM